MNEWKYLLTPEMQSWSLTMPANHLANALLQTHVDITRADEAVVKDYTRVLGALFDIWVNDDEDKERAKSLLASLIRKVGAGPLNKGMNSLQNDIQISGRKTFEFISFVNANGLFAQSQMEGVPTS